MGGCGGGVVVATPEGPQRLRERLGLEPDRRPRRGPQSRHRAVRRGRQEVADRRRLSAHAGSRGATLEDAGGGERGVPRGRAEGRGREADEVRLLAGHASSHALAARLVVAEGNVQRGHHGWGLIKGVSHHNHTP